jgi:hypothetical protein
VSDVPEEIYVLMPKDGLGTVRAGDNTLIEYSAEGCARMLRYAREIGVPLGDYRLLHFGDGQAIDMLGLLEASRDGEADTD